MVTDPKKRENKGGEQDLERTENAAGSQGEELQDEQLKDVAGGVDWQSYKERNPEVMDGGE